MNDLKGKNLPYTQKQKREEHKAYKGEAKLTPQPEKKIEKGFRVPPFTVGNHIHVKAVEIISDVCISEIKHKKPAIPNFTIPKLNFSRLSEIEATVLVEARRDQDLIVPNFNCINFKPIKASIFDTEFKVSAGFKSIAVPSISLAKFEFKPYAKFITDKQRIEQKGITFTEKSNIIQNSTKLGAEIVEDKKEFEQFDFIEFLLGKGSGKILSGKPLCIIVEKHPDKYEYVVATICREVYREKKGGYPYPIVVGTVDDVEFEFKADVSGQIVIVENATYSEVLRKVVSKFPFSDLGFLILVTDKPDELENAIRRRIPNAEEHLIRVEPVSIDEKLRNRMIEFLSGSKLMKSYSFGEDFIKATQRFCDQLEMYLDFSKAPNELKVVWHRLMAKSPESPEQASKEHSAMKSFVWQYIYKKYGRPPKIEDERGADLSIENEIYEIETFYGCGDPIAKLTDKMNKFDRSDRIYFVLRNVSVLMHLRDLISFERTWKELGYDVRIVYIDFKRKDLIGIDAVKRLLPYRRSCYSLS